MSLSDDIRDQIQRRLEAELDDLKEELEAEFQAKSDVICERDVLLADLCAARAENDRLRAELAACDGTPAPLWRAAVRKATERAEKAEQALAAAHRDAWDGHQCE